MRTVKILILSILVMSLNLLASVATVTALKGSADIQREDSVIKVSIGLELKQKDVVVTHGNSKLQIIFKDETIITLGKNSNFSVEEYMFEENQQPVAKFGMIKGAMRTITGRIGKIAPEKFSVQTKTATIGIRGTNFAVVVGEDGSYQAYCTYGAISVTVNGETYVVKQGFYINISPTGKVEIKEFTPEDLKDMKEKNFNSADRKTGEANKGDTLQTSQEDENNEQLDVTVTDYSDMVIDDVTDTTITASQIDGDLSQILASYTMNDASYTGHYHVTSVDIGGDGGLGGVGTTGSAQLDIDFGADTATLMLDGGTAEFYNHPSFSGTGFTLVQPGGVGTADGTFEGPTGNSVTGNFHHDVPSTQGSWGTYDVSTSQTLY